MTKEGSSAGAAYCGLVCAVCAHARAGCRGCREGGGDEVCHQRRCCVERGLAGCWECEDFPCDKGYFADEAWSGLCIGFVQAVREQGPEAVVRAARSALGETSDYGEYRFRDPEEVRAMLRGESTA
jgi:hypothetical protein